MNAPARFPEHKLGTPSPGRDCYTQGLTSDGRADGSFEVVRLPSIDLERALSIARSLPVPPDLGDPSSFCPPTFGFDGDWGNVCRVESGWHFIWRPVGGSQAATPEQVEQWVRAGFGG